MTITHAVSAVLLPVVGICVLLFAMGHSAVQTTPDVYDGVGVTISLQSPDPHFSPIRAIILQEEYQAYNNAYRFGNHHNAQFLAMDYNLVAAECAPDVFQKTHLPHCL